MSKKIIGVTVGTTLPKPNFKQNDPTKGDYIRNKPDFEGLKNQVDEISGFVGDKKVSEQIDEAIAAKQDKNLIVTYTDSKKTSVSHSTDEIADAADAGIEVKFYDGREYLNLLEYSKKDYLAVFYNDYYDSSNVLNVIYVVIGGNSVMMAETNKYNPVFKADLDKKQDKITGTAGQYVQFNTSGKPVGVNLDVYTKAEIDNMEFITVDEIDIICGGAIQYAEDVKF